MKKLTWLKICGITNLVDARAAAALGVDALGFVFAPGKRRVEAETVREIVARLPGGLEKIGVFLDREEEEVRRLAGFCGLTGLQFHGRETPAYCGKFPGYRIIKAFRVNAGAGWEQIPPYLEARAVDDILLDTLVPGVPGGTGETFPWDLVRDRDFARVPVIVAGGINPGNVTRALRAARPFGIDISSGVEREPGRKDADKMRELVRRVREGRNE